MITPKSKICITSPFAQVLSSEEYSQNANDNISTFDFNSDTKSKNFEDDKKPAAIMIDHIAPKSEESHHDTHIQNIDKNIVVQNRTLLSLNKIISKLEQATVQALEASMASPQDAYIPNKVISQQQRLSTHIDGLEKQYKIHTSQLEKLTKQNDDAFLKIANMKSRTSKNKWRKPNR